MVSKGFFLDLMTFLTLINIRPNDFLKSIFLCTTILTWGLLLCSFTGAPFCHFSMAGWASCFLASLGLCAFVVFQACQCCCALFWVGEAPGVPSPGGDLGTLSGAHIFVDRIPFHRQHKQLPVVHHPYIKLLDFMDFNVQAALHS